ncbi:D(1)-like dopamine receptor [Gigantopelta aegis]|uniref:D(1)-like dopamine receptor n=1 Tax=Gigantopelta aegis TaxID=1735272 RepID=UPI001B88860C|nr:D(1)-like dopamine receptor [Gigantopelta aegis]
MNHTQPQWNNTPHATVPWTRIVLGAGLYVIVFITVFGNCLVLVAVSREKRLRTIFNYYIVNLAVTDIAVAVTAMSFYTIENVLGYWPFGEFMCGVWIFFDYGMTFASVFTLIVISVDRFWSVSWSLHYRIHHRKKKAFISIAVVW